MLGPYMLSARGPGAYAGGEVDPGVDPPVVTVIDGDVTINGKVKPGSFGKFVYPLATVTAGRRYTIRVVSTFAQLTRQGDLAMVGFGFKNGNDFHITGLRGDGAGGTKEYIVHGTNPNGWNKQTGHTEVDGGAAAAGTQYSAYYRLTISSDGSTYTLETDTDGTSYATVFTAQAPTPFTNVSQVTTFGVALWFNNLDTGPFSVQVTEFLDEAATLNDPYIANVVLLINPAGADGSTTVTDASPIARGNATAAGNAQIDTALTDGGNPTMLFDGASDAFRFGDSSDWHLGSGSYFIEARVRFATITGSLQFIVCQWQGTPNLSWVLYLNGTSSLGFNYSTTGSDNTAVTGSWSPTTGVFYELGVGFDGSKIRLFVDGVMIGSSTVSPTLANSTLPLSIGGSATGGTFDFSGWISRLRITKGSARGIGDGGYSPQSAGHYPTS
jgi:hypothetical protein